MLMIVRSRAGSWFHNAVYGQLIVAKVSPTTLRLTRRYPARRTAARADACHSADMTGRNATAGAHRWNLRSVPEDLTRHYIQRGDWTDATLGMMAAAALGANPGATFAVRSDVRPWQGTFADVDRAARRFATSLRALGVGPGDVVAFQLPNWVEAAITFWGAMYVGAVVVPIVHFYRTEGSRLHPRGDPSRRRRHCRTVRRLGLRRVLLWTVAARGDWSWLVVGETDANRLPGRRRRSPSSLDAEPLGQPLTVDPDGPALVAFTSGTTRDPQGRGPLAPHDRLRDPSTRRDAAPAWAAADRGCAGRPLHGDAHGVPGAARAPAARAPDRRVGSRARPRVDARGPPGCRRRRHVLPDEPARPPRLQRRPPGAHALGRARRITDPRRRRTTGHAPRHRAPPLVRQHRAPIDHRVDTRRPRGQAPHDRRASTARCGAPPRRRGPDPDARSGLLPRLHRCRARPRRCSTRRVGTTRATSARSTTTATSPSPTASPTSSSAAVRTSARRRWRSCS